MKQWKLVVAACLLAACNGDGVVEPFAGVAVMNEVARGDVDLRAARASLLAADRAYSEASAQTNVVEGIASMLAPQTAMILGSRPLLTTPDAARAALAASASNLTSVQTWVPVRGDVSADGQYGYTYGYFEIRNTAGAVLPGKYTAFWQRQANGEWKAVGYRRVPRPFGPVSYEPPAGFEVPEFREYRRFPDALGDAVAQVNATDLAFSDAARQGLGYAFGRFAAPDGAILGGDVGIAFGREAIEAQYVGSTPGSLAWWPVHAVVAPSNDLGFTTGLAEVRDVHDDGSYTVVALVRYLSVWQRQRTGEWRYVID